MYSGLHELPLARITEIEGHITATGRGNGYTAQVIATIKGVLLLDEEWI